MFTEENLSEDKHAFELSPTFLDGVFSINYPVPYIYPNLAFSLIAHSLIFFYQDIVHNNDPLYGG
jgi:hypothetical protein